MKIRYAFSMRFLSVGPEVCHPASFRFHLAVDTLVIGYVFPTIRAHYGLTPIRLRPCWANYQKEVAEFRQPLLLNSLLQRPPQSPHPSPDSLGQNKTKYRSTLPHRDPQRCRMDYTLNAPKLGKYNYSGD